MGYTPGLGYTLNARVLATHLRVSGLMFRPRIMYKRLIFLLLVLQCNVLKLLGDGRRSPASRDMF